MRFVDALAIKIKAGKGGNGIISFRREAHVDRGGPDGGDGGNGGSIYFRGTTGSNTLYDLYKLKMIIAEDGNDGRPKNCYGRNGADKIIEVPIGTVVYDPNGQLICDIIDSNDYLVARGGRGGRGNVRFKTARNPAPRLSENGDPGQEYLAQIELRFISDIGLIGRPSAGKSSLINVLSNARSKVGDYDYTTLVPHLGLVRTSNNIGYVVADLPGIIAGAAQGRGLGIQFLQHVERARVLVYVVDVGTPDQDPVMALSEVANEIVAYRNGRLTATPRYILAHKCDLPGSHQQLLRLQQAYPDAEIIPTSVYHYPEIQALKDKLYSWYSLAECAPPTNDYVALTYTLEDEIHVAQPLVNLFELTGSRVRQIYDKIPLNSIENIQRFHHKLNTIGA